MSTHEPTPSTSDATDAKSAKSAKSAESRTVLCLASYYKGNHFLEQCKREGWKVVLVTLESLLKKPWVRESIDEVFALPTFTDRRSVVNAITYLAALRAGRR